MSEKSCWLSYIRDPSKKYALSETSHTISNQRRSRSSKPLDAPIVGILPLGLLEDLHLRR